MGSVELSIQLQIDDISAVMQQFAEAVVGRDPSTLWWLVDSANDMAYENRVKGDRITAIDQNVTKINFGPSLYGDWFSLHSAYFGQDKPLSGVTTLKEAIEKAYRWRVSEHFSSIMSGGVSPDYVFPRPGFLLGEYVLTGPTAGTYSKSAVLLDTAKVGPGVIAITPVEAPIGPADMTFEITAKYQDGGTRVLDVTVPSATEVTETLPIGWTALSADHTGATGGGVVTLESVDDFKVGNHVLIFQDLTGETPYLRISEVAVVISIDSGLKTLTLRQPKPVGTTTDYPNGLRNNYTEPDAKVAPLFVDVTVVANPAGTLDDKVKIHFYPDRPQEFLSDLSTP